MALLESAFQRKVTKKLDELIKKGHAIYYFVKEAGSIRGIPDLVGCANGQFFAWELKRDRSEAEKTSGRIVLQRYTLSRIEQARGIGRIVHPENLEECLQELEAICSQPVHGDPDPSLLAP